MLASYVRPRSRHTNSLKMASVAAPLKLPEIAPCPLLKPSPWASAVTATHRRTMWTTQILGVGLVVVLYWLMTRAQGTEKEKIPMYGLQHGRLHLQLPTPMWMNMGYWQDTTSTLSEACRDLLKAVLAEAGFSSEQGPTQPTKLLVDVGFGCGDQTIYLLSKNPVRACDEDWWDERDRCTTFTHYIGITKDAVQARYASERVEELKQATKAASREMDDCGTPTISLFCADASKPGSWEQELQAKLQRAKEDTEERWVLALDTAYHFSPSRWPIIEHAHSQLEANYMAFDLCLSPTASWTQKLTLRLLTALMGAPWANFTTPQQYRKKLEQIGYNPEAITITDISEQVFAPLAAFLKEQDGRLKTLGLGLGRFGVAKTMFGWWGRTGVVRGVVVVARK
jgi:hypothetical protein